ncbi:MAG: glycosyltransferase [Deltaproteobacteria bacterium]|nr:glycosyltransferase [Deltaproteobacteria bacterium]
MILSWFDQNLALLRQKQPHEAARLEDLRPQMRGESFCFPFSAGEVILTQGRSSFPALAIDLGAGPKRLTSGLDPQKEDILLADEFLKAGSVTHGLTVIGFGLGYHLEYLLQKLPPDSPLWLWEARPELAAAALAARDLKTVLKAAGFRLFLENRPGSRLPPDAPRTLLARPANLRLDSHLYPSKMKARRIKPPRILFLDAGYYLAREIPRAAESLRASVRRWSFSLTKTEGREYQQLLREIKDYRPELVLTVNHLGLDTEGILASVFARLGLPVASWFVDSPAYILKPGPQGDIFVFSWDSDYLEFLRQNGFSKVHYLPLATDPAIFRQEDTPLRRGLAFVGDSLTAATEKYLALSGLKAHHLAAVDRMAVKFLKNADLLPDGLSGLLAEKENLDPDQKINLLALITWRAGRLARIKVLRTLKDLNPTVCGDSGWSGILPEVSLAGQLDYYRDLAPFYRSTAVNLNITSAQMKTGLNQRVFDVPACGGFLLTDFRKQLNGLFEQDEIVTYASPQEAKSLAKEYLAHPRERQNAAQKAKTRVLGQHLYTHRLQEMFKVIFGAGS